MYKEGLGTEKNINKALYYFEKAHNEYGFNVKKDINTALKYYEKSRLEPLYERKLELLNNNDNNKPIYTMRSMNCNIYTFLIKEIYTNTQ